MLTLVVASAATPFGAAVAADTAQDVGTQLTQALKAALEGADPDAMARIFSADAVAMPPQNPNLEGRAAIRKFYADLFSAYALRIETVVVETRLDGDHGYTRGTYRLTLTPRDGSAVTVDEGRYLTLLRRQPDGTWLVTREMTNSITPPG